MTQQAQALVGESTHIHITCFTCSSANTVTVQANDAVKFYDPNRKEPIQAIFPYLSAEDRELLISRTCPKCWDEMVNNLDPNWRDNG